MERHPNPFGNHGQQSQVRASTPGMMTSHNHVCNQEPSPRPAHMGPPGHGPVLIGPPGHGHALMGPLGHRPVLTGPPGHGPAYMVPPGHGPAFIGPPGHGPMLIGPPGHGAVYMGPSGQGPMLMGPPGQMHQPVDQPLSNATQALQQLLQTLRNPSCSNQQSEVLKILKTHPQLMAAFIRHRQIQLQLRQQQQLEQQQQQIQEQDQITELIQKMTELNPIVSESTDHGPPGQIVDPGQPQINSTEALERILQVLKDPPSAHQQSEVLHLLKTHPQLMGAFIRFRQQQQQQQQQQKQEQQQLKIHTQQQQNLHQQHEQQQQQ